MRIKRLVNLVVAVALLAGLASQAMPQARVSAAPAQQITSRSLTLEPGATAGGSSPGVADTSAYYVNHLFKFTLNDTTDNLGSIVFQYCTTAAAVKGGTGCVAPVGIDTTNATLGTNLGATGWTAPLTPEAGWDDANDSVHNAVLLSRTPNKLTAPTAVTIELDNIVNPSAANETFFVRIWTFSTSTITYTPSTGAPLDNTDANDGGTVAAATANPIILNGTMPESLVFCTGAIISETSGVPDCTTATAGNISFNQLFSPTSTAYATSQMAASTNAGSGYSITVNGATLTSGSNTITPMTTTDTSKFGISQFGIDLVKNDGTAYANAPNISNMAPYSEADSADITPASGTGNYNAEALTGYATAGSFTFVAGAPTAIADSTSKASDSQIYTASYIVNVPGSQAAGTYTTTLTYICTPTF